MDFDTYLPYITAAGVIGTLVYGIWQMIESQKRRAKEHEETLIAQNEKNAKTIIGHIDDKLKIIDEKFRTTDSALIENKDDIEDIGKDVEKLQEDFNEVCYKLGKHDYAIDKVFPEYLNLKNSINDFKTVVDSKILTNIDKDVTTTEEE